MDSENKNPKCCLCKNNYKGDGYNPSPLLYYGRCCDICNVEVIKIRHPTKCSMCYEFLTRKYVLELGLTYTTEITHIKLHCMECHEILKKRMLSWK